MLNNSYIKLSTPKYNTITNFYDALLDWIEYNQIKTLVDRNYSVEICLHFYDTAIEIEFMYLKMWNQEKIDLPIKLIVTNSIIPLAINFHNYDKYLDSCKVNTTGAINFNHAFNFITYKILSYTTYLNLRGSYILSKCNAIYDMDYSSFIWHANRFLEEITSNEFKHLILYDRNKIDGDNYVVFCIKSNKFKDSKVEFKFKPQASYFAGPRVTVIITLFNNANEYAQLVENHQHVLRIIIIEFFNFKKYLQLL